MPFLTTNRRFKEKSYPKHDSGMYGQQAYQPHIFETNLYVAFD